MGWVKYCLWTKYEIVQNYIIIKRRAVGFFIFASSSAAIALLQLDFFQQSHHLRFLTSWLSLKAESADYSGWVGREMYRLGQRHSWGHRRRSRHRRLWWRQRCHRWLQRRRRHHWCADGGGGMLADRMLSCRKLSQLDDNVSPPLSCCIPLLFATTADLLLDQTATVFTCFREGPGGAGIELVGGRQSRLELGQKRRRPP